MVRAPSRARKAAPSGSRSSSMALVSIAIVSIAIVSIASAVVVGVELGGLGSEVSTCVGNRVSWWVPILTHLLRRLVTHLLTHFLAHVLTHVLTHALPYLL